MKMNVLSNLTLLFIAIFISGCGGSDTTIVERAPIAIEDDHDQEEEKISRGRLLISTKDQAKVSLLDIDKQQVLHEFTLSDIPAAIYASPGYRYGFVLQRTADRVDVIDGGLWQEDHGDHLHDYDQAPLLMAFNTNKTRPTHFTRTEKQAVIFYDGNVDTAIPAALGVFTETDIANNTPGTWLDYTTHMHGAAQARGDYVVATLRDAATTSTLPDRVAIYRAHNGFFVDENILTETCPGLHGSAQNKNQITFGCTDGVLVITQTGATFSATKIANPVSFTDSMRIGSLVGDQAIDTFVGIASGQFFAINPGNNTVTAINWIDTALAEVPGAIGYGFADEGKLFVLLDNQGRLTLLDTLDWSVKNRVQVIQSNPGALTVGSRFELALTPGHIAYVSDPIANQIKQINLLDARVSETIQLNFIPHKLTWLGIAQPATGNHSH